MGKKLFISEKPSVAQEFAKVLTKSVKRRDGYLESEEILVTWCVGHLVTMSYPEVYDATLKKWRLDTLPFLPKEFKYEVIPAVRKQFDIVAGLLSRDDIDTIYVCTDSGREGEYIYRLVDQMANVTCPLKKRVWIDSQTEEEIKRGVLEAKDLSIYDNLAQSAYLRAKEDYLMGINFSRLLTLKFGPTIAKHTNQKWAVVSIGRVMTCVLGMVVRREREIREFVKTPFYRILGQFVKDDVAFETEWKVDATSKHANMPYLYKENGFKDEAIAKGFVEELLEKDKEQGTITKVERKKEKKLPPLLFNLAELQNECSKRLKINPEATSKIAQELYEKKLVTYPRTDARVISTAVAKEVIKNIKGLENIEEYRPFVENIITSKSYEQIAKTKYTDDKQITDHYAIIPTGNIHAYRSLAGEQRMVYDFIVRRFLSVFYPAVIYQKTTIFVAVSHDAYSEAFSTSVKLQENEGFFAVLNAKTENKKDDLAEAKHDPKLLEMFKGLKKGMMVMRSDYTIKAGETTPPSRYTSGSLILAMENAGQLIEDESLREQIRGAGIGTSATRAEILKKLLTIKYLSLNNKTQVITPALLGEYVYEATLVSMPQMLNPDLTASWEKGLSYVSQGTTTTQEYMKKLEDFIIKRVERVKQIRQPEGIEQRFYQIEGFYKK